MIGKKTKLWFKSVGFWQNLTLPNVFAAILLKLMLFRVPCYLLT